MKTLRNLLIITFTFFAFIETSVAQNTFNITTNGEFIFSFAPNVENNGVSGKNIIRWTPWFNLQSFGAIYFNKHIDGLVGMSVKNIGFIDDYADPSNSKIKKKYRTYNFGLPVGVKVNILNNLFVFGGYEIEFPFHYKEKTFENNNKMDNKITEWFSNRTACCFHTVFAGVQFPGGLSIKFKYYMNNFFNEDFSVIYDGGTYFPYRGKKANIMYVSFSFSLFKEKDIESSSNNTN